MTTAAHMHNVVSVEVLFGAVVSMVAYVSSLSMTIRDG